MFVQASKAKQKLKQKFVTVSCVSAHQQSQVATYCGKS